MIHALSVVPMNMRLQLMVGYPPGPTRGLVTLPPEVTAVGTVDSSEAGPAKPTPKTLIPSIPQHPANGAVGADDGGPVVRRGRVVADNVADNPILPGFPQAETSHRALTCDHHNLKPPTLTINFPIRVIVAAVSALLFSEAGGIDH